MKTEGAPIAEKAVETGTASPDVRAVREFWNQNPLFSGESAHAPGEKEFFEEHQRVTLREHSGALDPMLLRDSGPGKDVVDVGCGIGFWTEQLARRGARVQACDLSDAGANLTRRRAELFQFSARVCQGNAEQLPYRDASFDHVNCQGVIHHTPETAACLREFHRVLRPQGTLCFSVYYKGLPLRSRALFRVVSAITRPVFRLKGRGRENMMAAPNPDEIVRLYDGAENPLGKAYTRAEVRLMLAGRFDVLEEKRIGFPRRMFAIPMPDGVHRLFGRLFGLMIVLRCRKRETGE